MFEIISGWSAVSQILFLWGFLVIGFCLAWITLDTIKVVIRGYPPHAPVPIYATSCDHDENLTGKCIKEHGNCKTQAECDEEISKRTPLPVTTPKHHDETTE